MVGCLYRPAPTILNPTTRLGAAVDKRLKRLLVTLLVVAPALIIGLVFVVLPKAETPRDAALPPGDHQLLATVDVQDGGPDHPAEGNVSLYWNGTGYFLRFQGFESRSGPNVWFFATRTTDADSEQKIEDEGLLVRVPGPGQATYRGTFNVPLPPEFTPSEYPALVAWDRTFDTRFALAVFGDVAPMEPVSPDDTNGGNGTAEASSAPGAPSQHP